jgi:hypothetical protein
LGLLGQAIAPSDVSSPGLYVMLGMAAMMGAVVQAPLAALMTVLELTGNSNAILPAMLIIVVATLVTSEVFQKQSVFLTTLKTLGLEYPPSPVTMHMQRAAVASLMHRNFVRTPERITVSEANALLERKPLWIVVEENKNSAHCLLNPSDLAAWLDELASGASDELEGSRETRKRAKSKAAEQSKSGENQQVSSSGERHNPAGATDQDSKIDALTNHSDRANTQGTTEPAESAEAEAAPAPVAIELLKIPGQREDVVDVDIRSTLQEALDALNKQGVKALCVRRTSMPLIAPIMGVMTRDDINNYRSK